MRARRKNPKSVGGFTLIEVMVALAIVAMTAVVLLGRQSEVLPEVVRAKAARIGWILASQKLADLELDKSVWQGDGSESSGDFHELDGPPPARPMYAGFTWAYGAARMPVVTTDPQDPSAPTKKPKEVFHVLLKVEGPGLDDPIILEAMFPVPDQSGAAPTGPDAPSNPSAPSGPTSPSAPGPSPPPGPGGPRK